MLQTILNLLAGLDWVPIISALVSFIIGLSFVKPMLSNAHGVIHSLGAIIKDIDDGLDDGKLSKEEIQEIVKEAKELIAIFKKGK